MSNGGGKGPGGGQPTVLTFKERPSYKDGTVTATVEATRGQQPQGGVLVHFYLDGKSQGNSTSDLTGSAVFFQANISLDPGDHSLTAEVVGQTTKIVEKFPVPKPGEATEDSPVLELTGEAIQVKDGFELSLRLKVVKSSQPVVNKAVNFVYFDQTIERYTDASGIASTLINVPHPTKTLKRFVEVRCIMEDPRAETQKVFELQWQAPEVKEANFLDEVKTGPNEYTVRVIVEGPTGAGVPGLKISAAGGKKISEVLTNEYGIADISLKCKPDQEKTKFTIDVPGVQKNWVKELRGDKATETGEGVKKEKRKGKEASLLDHLKQGFRVGSGKSKLSDEEVK